MNVFRASVSIIACVSLGILAGCGSSGGGDSAGTPSDPPYTGPTVQVSGTATYDFVPATSSGLNYAGTTSKPIRGASVEVRNTSGSHIYFRANTDASGAYTISAPASMAVQIVVRATLGSPTAPDTSIVDNTTSDAVYAVYLATTTTTANATGVAIHAASGWNGTSYGTRAAAPFAILDTIYEAHQLILSANSTIAWPALKVGWSPANTVAAVGTSSYDPSTGRITILGGADEDTDEFDDHVIAHEWGHFFEANFSRSDSLGGSHGAGDILDETVAFGEGWGNAFSGMATSDPFYFDTQGAHQSATGVAMDLEANSELLTTTVGGGDMRTLDGAWSEASVQEIIWDIYDGGVGAVADTDSDGVNLGFTPLYQTFVGAQKTTGAFTTLYSFLDALKTANGLSAVAIGNLEAAEGIGTHDALEETVSHQRCTTLPTNGTVVTMDVDGHALQTYNTYGAIDSQYPSNRLYNRLLFRTTAPSTGTFKIQAIPTNSAHDLYVLQAGPTGDYRRSSPHGTVTLTLTATAGQVLEFAVGSYANTANTTGVVPFTIRFGTPAVITKPGIPSGDG